MKKEFYEEYFLLEKDYWFFRSRRKIALGILDRMLKGRRDLRILDAGTGTGVMIEALKRYGHVTGVDSSEEAIRYCRERGICGIVNASAEDMPFEDGSLDLICAMDLLEHVEDDVRVLKEFSRVLKPGGLVFLTVPAYRFLWTAHDEINMHRRRYGSRELKAAVESAGFVVRKFSHFNSLLFPFVAGAKILRRLCSGRKRACAKSDFIPVPRVVNGILGAIFSSESILLKLLNFPYGVSLMCAASKPLTT